MGVFGTSKKKLYAGSKKIKKAYLGSEKIYSSGNIVTYIVDTGVAYTEEVEEGASCTHPTSFTPSKNGWTFVGWRIDNRAVNEAYNVNGYNDKMMGDEPITLYALFKQTVTLTYYNNSTSKATTSGTKYYNNGNVANPKFTLSQASKSGWSTRGWATSTTANASVAYSSINNTEFSANATLYGLYSKTIKLSYNGNGSTSGSVSSQSGTAYYNSAGNMSNPSFKLASNGFAKTNYTFIKWARDSASGTKYAVGASVTLSSNTTFYAYWVETLKSYVCNKAVQMFTAEVAGTYMLKVWGAQGDKGNMGALGHSTYDGGLGGYSKGVVYLNKGQTIYIVVGDGGNKVNASANYNGGGSVTPNVSGLFEGGAGGGATHIATTNRGELKNYKSHTTELLLVAGGGGGGGLCGSGGSGGGTSGGSGKYNDNKTSHPDAVGGSQTSGYAFGLGASSSDAFVSGGGGGGYYGGFLGGNVNGASGGGGGSGYTGDVSDSETLGGQNAGSGKAIVELVSVA